MGKVSDFSGDTTPSPLRTDDRTLDRAAALYGQLRALRTAVAEEGDSLYARWRPRLRRRGFRAAARNLAHFLALRRRDIRQIQTGLSSLGLSSLGGSEARILPTLDAVIASLGRIAGPAAGSPSPAYPPTSALRRGAASLARGKIEIFGPDPTGPRTRIMATLPARAATDRAMARDLIAAGTDCVRINCAHDDQAVWAAMIANVRAAARRAGRQCRVLMDLAGPKCRLVEIWPKRRFRVTVGDRIVLGGSAPPPGERRLVAATLTHPRVLSRLRRGDEVWINDGKIGARVVKRLAGGRVVARVVVAPAKGARLKSGKGVNFPGTPLNLPPLTEKDLADLDFVARHADVVGYSFVQRPADIAWLQRELARRRGPRPPLPLVIKIETRLGLRNLPELIVQGAGAQPLAVMIARGDLAVELGFDLLSEAQEQLLWLCEAAQVPVVWATQVLEGLVRKGAPSRAEATDAAMAQHAECVMLNKGDRQVEAARFLDGVLRRMDRHRHKHARRLGRLGLWAGANKLRGGA